MEANRLNDLRACCLVIPVTDRNPCFSRTGVIICPYVRLLEFERLEYAADRRYSVHNAPIVPLPYLEGGRGVLPPRA
jgi:hypothetical protein